MEELNNDTKGVASKEAVIASTGALISLPFSKKESLISCFWAETDEINFRSSIPARFIGNLKTLGYRAVISNSVYAHNQRPMAIDLSNGVDVVVDAVVDFPIIVAGILFKVYSDSDNPVASMKISNSVERYTETTEGGVPVTTVDIYSADIDLNLIDNIAIFGHRLATPRRQYDENTATVQTLENKAASVIKMIADSNDAVEVGDVKSMTMKYTCSNPNIKVTAYLITPGSDEWDEFVAGCFIDSTVAKAIKASPEVAKAKGVPVQVINKVK